MGLNKGKGYRKVVKSVKQSGKKTARRQQATYSKLSGGRSPKHGVHRRKGI